MRWVLLQAGSLWYFKDQTLKEQLGRMPLFGCKLEPGATARHFSLVSEQRTLHLRAADRTEALAWQAVLRRALAELAPAQSAERVLVDGVEALLAPLLDVGAAGGNAALLPEQEEALCVLLLTLHSFSTAERLAELLRDAYHASYDPSAAALPLKMWAALEQAPRCRRVGYTLLRWAQLHPADFSSADGNDVLRDLWQRCAADGHLYALGLRTQSYVGGDGPAMARQRSAARTPGGGQRLDGFSDVMPLLSRQSSTKADDAAAAAPAAAPVPSPVPPPISKRATSTLELISEEGAAPPASADDANGGSSSRLATRRGSQHEVQGDAPSLPALQPLRTPSDDLAEPSDVARATARASEEAVLVARGSAWAPFCAAADIRAGLGSDSGRSWRLPELSPEELDAAQLREALGCANLPTAPPAPQAQSLRASLAGLPARRASTSGSEPGGGGKADEARLLQHAQLALALQWPLAQDSVQPAQWLALSPRSLAEFFTLCDERLYQSVGHAHLLSYVWGGGAKDAHHPKRAPPRSPAPPRPVARHSDAALSQLSAELKQPLMQFTQQFNETANLISSAVVGAPSVGERAALLTHFVAVGVELRALRNFNGVNAVLAGLSNSAVHRMKCAKERLSNKTRADWEGLQRLMSCGGSYKHYRAALAEVRRRPPFIPYLGVHLTDLVMLGEVLKLEGGPSKAEGKVNLTKRQQVHASIALCLAGRGARYGFAALPGIARMVEGASHMSEEQLYDASLAREPRGSCLADLEKIDAERASQGQATSTRATRASTARSTAGSEA